MGYFMRGLGAGLRDAAEGQVHLGIARQLALENHREAFFLWHEKRNVYAATQAGKRANRPSSEKLAYLARIQRPAPLTAEDLADDGTVHWPLILCEARFDRSRNAIDSAVQQLVAQTSGSKAAALRRFLILHCEAMQAELLTQVGKSPCGEYLSGRNFLDSLRCELLHPERLAAREYLVQR
jgi:hypothetical protein